MGVLVHLRRQWGALIPERVEERGCVAQQVAVRSTCVVVSAIDL
jgi:hypothetical protein